MRPATRYSVRPLSDSWKTARCSVARLTQPGKKSPPRAPCSALCIRSGFEDYGRVKCCVWVCKRGRAAGPQGLRHSVEAPADGKSTDSDDLTATAKPSSTVTRSTPHSPEVAALRLRRAAMKSESPAPPRRGGPRRKRPPTPPRQADGTSGLASDTALAAPPAAPFRPDLDEGGHNREATGSQAFPGRRIARICALTVYPARTHLPTGLVIVRMRWTYRGPLAVVCRDRTRPTSKN